MSDIPRLGKRQIRTILSLEQDVWGPAFSHAAAKNLFWNMAGTGKAIVFHKHRTNNCWSLTNFGAQIKAALLERGA